MSEKKNKEIDDLMKNAQFNKEQGNLLDALYFLEEIIKIDKDNKRALNNIGNVFKEIGNYEKAIKFYEKAVSADDNYLIAKTNLAILYHELGNLKKAEQIYRKMITLDKFNFSIYFNLSRISFNYFKKEIIDFIENSLENKNISNYNKASAYFILAKNEQIKKNFSEEVAYLKKGHEFFCKSVQPKVFHQSLNYWLNIIPKKFNKIKLTNTQSLNKKNKLIKPIFIIGMPRSGSTLIESIISSGKIKIPNGGETAIVNWGILKAIRDEIFNEKINEDNLLIDVQKISKDIISRYENLNLLKEDKDYFFTDKSLENFFYIEILLKLFPNSKFIHCKRNNLDTIFAIYQNFLTKMSWTHSFENIIDYLNSYLDVTKYFEKKFSNKIYSLNLSDLTQDSSRISKEIFEFCGLEWSKESLEYHKRKDLYSKTASNIQIREKIYEYDKKKYKIYKSYIKGFEEQYEWLKEDI